MARKPTVVPLREIWKQERSLVQWLEQSQGLAALGEATDLRLLSARREHAVGDFSVDLVACCPKGRVVVVECQFGYSDHDHLGKLITYLATTETDAAVWVAEHFRREHVKAIQWLNAASAARFHLVQVAAERTGESKLSPRLTLVRYRPGGAASPLQEAPPKEDRERHDFKKQFWEGFSSAARTRLPLLARRKAGTGSDRTAPTGINGAEWVCRVNEDRRAVCLRLSHTRGSQKEIGAVLRRLKRRQKEITAAFGDIVEITPGRGTTLVGTTLKNGGYKNERNEWPRLQKAMVNKMLRLQSALRPYLQA